MPQITSVQIIEMFSEIAATMADNSLRLCRLDEVGGDGDHGITMDKGFTQLEKSLASLDPRKTSPYMVFDIAAETFLKVDSAAAKLYASGFRRAGTILMVRRPITDTDFSAAFLAMAQGIIDHGHAGPDRRNMVDAWYPAADAYRASEKEGAPLIDRLTAALEGARVVNTAKQKSDAGAVSAVLMIRAIRDSFATAV